MLLCTAKDALSQQTVLNDISQSLWKFATPIFQTIEKKPLQKKSSRVKVNVLFLMYVKATI